MKLVAITTRLDHDAQRAEWRDMLDPRWSRFLRACGLLPVLLPNDPETAAQLLARLDPVGVVLSGGGNCQALSGQADARDDTEQRALQWARAHRRPVMGVCRGMQVLIGAAGGSLVPVANHVRTRHELKAAGREGAVNSYHDHGAYETPGLEVLARSDDGVVEWVSGDAGRLMGVMWHPEREADFSAQDIQMFRRFFGDQQA